jgi:hypothetical protein
MVFEWDETKHAKTLRDRVSALTMVLGISPGRF